MKKITLILVLLFAITFSWQGNAQLTEDFEAGITNLANATGNTVDFDIETTIVYGGTQSVKNGYTGSNLNILEQAVAMDLSTTNAPILDFWHIAKTEGTWDKCYVEISTDGGATYTELPAVSYVGSAASYAEDLYFDEDSYTDWGVTDVPVDNAWWKKERFELSAYKVANVKIRFRFTSDSSVLRAGWYIDNVTVFDPTCAVAESISVANITTTTADVSWTDNNGLTATDYEYVVQPMGTGVPAGAGTATTANPQPLTGLMASTQYEVYLRAVCGASDYSEWNKADFATSCDAFGSFTENFDATANGEVPLCWSNVVNSADAAASVDAQGGVIEFSNAADAAAELILVTPELTDLPLDTHRIRFSAQGDAGYAVQIGTMDSPTGTFTPVFGFALTNVMTDYSYSFEASTTDAYVAIKAVLPAVNNTIVLDNFNWEPIPSCVEPVSLNLSGITGNDVTISWTETGSATEWEYVIQAPGAGIPAAAGTSTMTNPVTDTSLSPVTDYEVYVRAVCGVADESIWIGPSTFTTPCVVISPPYTETFTTYVPNCWSEATNGDIASGPTGFGSSSWFPEEFAHVGTGLGAVNINLYTLGTSDWLISPQFDLSSGGYEVVLDVALTGYNNTTPGTFGSDDEVQLLYTEDGVTWNNLQTWNAGNEPVAGGETISVALASIGSSVQFALWGSEGVIDDPEDMDFHIDNFKVRIPPTCYEPTAIVVSNETLDGATFTWTENNNPAATTWDLYIVPTGDAAPNAASTPTINDDTTQNVVWTGATASSTYDVYVRTDCGADNTNVSVWSVVESFTTLCDVFMAPYTQDFENAGDLNTCWSQVNTDDLDWTVLSGPTSSTNTGPTAANSGSYYVYVETSGSSANDTAVLLSPSIDISALTIPVLNFTYHMYGAGMDSNGNLDVAISTDGGATFTSVFNQVGNQGDQWNNEIIDLTSYTGVVSFKMTGTVSSTGTTYENDFAIDDFIVEEGPTCFVPESLSVSNIDAAAGTVDLSWTDNTSPANGWEYEIVDVTAGNTATGTGVATATNPVSIAGLAANNEYEFLVRAICGAGDESLWSSAFSWTQMDIPGCASNPTPVDAAIDVAVGTVTFSWDAPVTGGTVDSYDIYAGTDMSNLTLLTNTVNLTIDRNIPFYEFFDTILYWQVVPKNGGGAAVGCPIWSITTEAQPVLANDDCDGATPVTVGVLVTGNPVDGTVFGANSDVDVDVDTCGEPGNGVWYSIEVPSDGAVVIEVTPDTGGVDGFDSVLEVFSGACSSLTSIGCNDDEPAAVGNYSKIELTGLTPNEIIYARVWEYGGNDIGTFAVSAYNPNIIAVEDLATVGFNYYPNPVSNNLTMTANENITSVRIFNMLGQEVRNEKLSTLEANIDMSNLSNGTYFVKAQVGTTVGTFKIIKK